MSRPWNPDDELARAIAADEVARARRRWPEGATVGVLLVAVSCIVLGSALYRFAGPRPVVEKFYTRP